VAPDSTLCLCFAPTPFPTLPAPKCCINHVCNNTLGHPQPEPSTSAVREEPSSHGRTIITLHLIDTTDRLWSRLQGKRW
uniref:Uncharacterized protein n=1 Tax=Falco tinnunculus TaxID=100819 RepID=A0A8C4UKC9_FALTI